jgi:flagellin
MTILNYNVAAQRAATTMTRNDKVMNTSMSRLATGVKLNQAEDGPATIGVYKGLELQAATTRAGIENINNAISYLRTVDDAGAAIENLLIRMKEIAVEAQTGTLSSDQIAALNVEYQILGDQWDRIATDTKWNTETVLDATARKIQVGADSGQIITYTEPEGQDDYGLTASAISVVSSISAAAAITQIDTDIATANVSRATAGAFITRFEGALDNALEMVQNVTDTRSRILDTDYAAELAELAKLQIMQQATNAMMAQANAIPNSVLAMLQ